MIPDPKYVSGHGHEQAKEMLAGGHCAFHHWGQISVRKHGVERVKRAKPAVREGGNGRKDGGKCSKH